MKFVLPRTFSSLWLYSMVEDDRQAIHDLTRMAFLYIQSGDLDKAAELMALAEQIENRVRRESRDPKEVRQQSN
jgi:hypothetical protein